MTIDVYVPGRWYFKTPTNPEGQPLEDPWVFTNGVPIAPPGRLHVPLSRSGSPLDFTSAGVGFTPILSERVAAVFRDMALQDVQLFPVEVEGQTQPYFLLVVARTVRCIDDGASEGFRLWTPEQGRPEKVGQYRAVSGLRIDTTKVGDERVFRLWGLPSSLIVDGELKAALERAGIVGGRFVAV
ncbi:imm11 family protein [Corallococcus sp. CA047B]|uniref:imm11 family protein n=1 Tax=Corallococcus sp. CA047B TaxID=2316729 RepID=UPI00351A284C